ncbi:DUF7261 family protein [Halomarina rubra]|uniref:Flagellin n=1 Tax=Halomarina rubra TaxID=2071873 RepID=A0ABD6ASC7_9EURY|nr:hypothetical protein [Halomarina rubra]
MAAVRERGQLILVGGLSLAVVLVAIALVMNAAIYTESLASRDDAGELGKPASIESDLSAAVESMMLNDFSESEISDGVGEFSSSSAYFAAQDGAITSASVQSTNAGTLVTDSSGSFVSADGDASWTVVDSKPVRSFEMTVNEDSLGSAFEMEVTSPGGDPWTIDFSASGDTLTMTFDDTETTVTCSTTPDSEEDAKISFSSGRLGGSQCVPMKRLFSGESVYKIRFVGGDAAAGTYSLVVDEDVTTMEDYDDDGDDTETDYGSDSGDPTVAEELYSVELLLEYDSPEIQYETTVVVAPGENDD